MPFLYSLGIIEKPGQIPGSSPALLTCYIIPHESYPQYPGEKYLRQTI